MSDPLMDWLERNNPDMARFLDDERYLNSEAIERLQTENKRLRAEKKRLQAELKYTNEALIGAYMTGPAGRWADDTTSALTKWKPC